MTNQNDWPVLCDLFNLMRDMAYRLADEIDEKDFDDCEGGGHSPNWIVGHLALGMDFGLQMLGHETPQLDAMMPLYGPGSKGGPMGDQGRSKSQLLEHLRGAGDQLAAALKNLDAEVLRQPNETPFFAKELPTVAGLLGHIVSTHLAMHTGQLSQWRRVRGMNSLFQFG